MYASVINNHGSSDDMDIFLHIVKEPFRWETSDLAEEIRIKLKRAEERVELSKVG